MRGMYLTYCSSDRISIRPDPHGQSTTLSASRNLHSNAIPLITKATGPTAAGTSDGTDPDGFTHMTRQLEDYRTRERVMLNGRRLA